MRLTSRHHGMDVRRIEYDDVPRPPSARTLLQLASIDAVANSRDPHDEGLRRSCQCQAEANQVANAQGANFEAQLDVVDAKISPDLLDVLDFDGPVHQQPQSCVDAQTVTFASTREELRKQTQE